MDGARRRGTRRSSGCATRSAPRGIHVPTLALELGRSPALLAVLRFAGLSKADQMEAAIVFARLPAAVAEGLATPSHSLRDYAVELPPIRYSEET